VPIIHITRNGPEWLLTPYEAWLADLFFIAKKEGAAVAKVAEAGSASEKKRVKRDKDAPKKPLSPFFCYQAIRRPLLIAEQPTLKNTEII